MSWGEALGTGLGRVAYRLGWRRGVVEAQLARAYPDRDQAWVRRTARASFEHVGREAVVMAALSRLGLSAVRRFVETFDALDAVRAALAEGRGVVIVTGHFGNWEIAGATLPANGLPIDGVMRALANRRLDRYVQDVRTRLGMRVVERTSAWDRLLASVRAGRIVGLVADQDAHRDGVFVPFFGQLASTHRTPALLAIRGGAALFVAGVRRVGPRRYEFWCERLDVAAAPDVKEQVLELTRGWTRELERHIRLSPEQYFWHHRRWKTRPPGTEAVGAGIRSGQVSE